MARKKYFPVKRSCKECPRQFDDVSEYRESFKILLEEEEKAQRLTTRRQMYTGMHAVWDSITNPMNKLCLSTRMKNTHSMQRGCRVRISCQCSEESVLGIITSVKTFERVGFTLFISTDSKFSLSWVGCPFFTVKAVFCHVPFSRMRSALNKSTTDKVFMKRFMSSFLGEEEGLPVVITPEDRRDVPDLPMSLNCSQMKAVELSLAQSFLLIQGPPGTGKSTTSVAIVYAFAKKHKGQVLVCAPSNLAIDHLALRISAAGLRVVRVVSQQHVPLSCEVEALQLNNIVDRSILKRPQNDKMRIIHEMIKHEIELDRDDRVYYDKCRCGIERHHLSQAKVVCTTCSSSALKCLDDMTFPSVLIDEATQAVEPEVLMPLLRGAERAVLVGDQCQLSSVVQSSTAKNAGLDCSLFERLLVSGRHKPHLLDIQYRMHPCISEFPSKYFYGGAVKDGICAESRTRDGVFPWPDKDSPIFFYHCATLEDRSGYSSFLNAGEAALVEQIVTVLLSSHCVNAKDIGVVTPYNEQRQCILSHLCKGQLGESAYEGVEVGSVDCFQGREKEYIVFSCVRSNPNGNIGFLADSRRLNVALTRAKNGLIIIGNASILSRHPAWREQLVHLQERSLLVSGSIKDLTPAEVQLKPFGKLKLT